VVWSVCTVVINFWCREVWHTHQACLDGVRDGIGCIVHGRDCLIAKVANVLPTGIGMGRNMRGEGGGNKSNSSGGINNDGNNKSLSKQRKRNFFTILGSE
jgi:hypothetical protein